MFPEIMGMTIVVRGCYNLKYLDGVVEASLHIYIKLGSNSVGFFCVWYCCRTSKRLRLGSNRLVSLEESWFYTTRSLQVVGIILNDVARDYLGPVLVNFAITSSVLTLYLVIKSPSIMVKTMAFGYAFWIILFVDVCCKQFSKILKISEKALQLKQEEVDPRDKCTISRLKTCFVPKLHLGNFRKLDISTLKIVLGAIVEYTVSMLITLNWSLSFCMTYDFNNIPYVDIVQGDTAQWSFNKT